VVNNNIQAGTMMIEESLLLPEGLRPETDSYHRTWRIVKDIDGFEFDRGARKSGWNFIFVEGRIKVLVVGWRKKEMIKRAVSRLLAIVKSRWFNSAEITSVASGSFLGIPYVSLSGNSRQIQQGGQLLDAAGRKSAEKDAAWACR
jgi:hypothetical protein